MPGDAILLDTLFANAPFGLAFWDTELRFGRINEALATMNGVPIADHLGRTVGEVLPDIGGGGQERLERGLRTGGAVLPREGAGGTAGRGIADGGALPALDPEGRFATLGVAHADPAREALAWELMQRYPPTVGDAVGIPYVVRTGRSDVMDPISDDVLVSVARDERHLDLLRRLGIGATAIVPLQTPERLIGAFALATEHGRRLTAGDVAGAQAPARPPAPPVGK